MDTNKQTLHWTPVTVKMQLGHLCTCVLVYPLIKETKIKPTSKA